MITTGPTSQITWCTRFWSDIAHSATPAEFALRLEQRDRRYLKVLKILDQNHTNSFKNFIKIRISEEPKIAELLEAGKISPNILISILSVQENEDTNFREIYGSEYDTKIRQARLIERDFMQQARLLDYFAQKNALYSNLIKDSSLFLLLNECCCDKYDLTRWEND